MNGAASAKRSTEQLPAGWIFAEFSEPATARGQQPGILDARPEQKCEPIGDIAYTIFQGHG